MHIDCSSVFMCIQGFTTGNGETVSDVFVLRMLFEHADQGLMRVNE